MSVPSQRYQKVAGRPPAVSEAQDRNARTPKHHRWSNEWLEANALQPITGRSPRSRHIRRGGRHLGRMRQDEGMARTLVLLRHGYSDWNAKNLFTGWVDVDLNARGEAEARRGGDLLREHNLLPDVVH